MTDWISSYAVPHARTLRDTNDQEVPACAIVLHITGRATYLNAEKYKKPPLDWLSLYFNKVGNPFAHYSVDSWGRIACHADERQTPYAQGWAAYGGSDGIVRRLAKGKLTVWKWWSDRWSHLPSRRGGSRCLSPLDLLTKDQATPNSRSVAIEFIQHGNQLKLTAMQYVNGNELLVDICKRHGLPVDQVHVFGHSDVDPWGRGTPEGSWDPGAPGASPTFSWDAMFTGVPDSLAVPTPRMPSWAK